MVTLPGEIDIATAESAYMQIVAELARGVIAAMTATRFCDTLGARALVLAYHQATELGSELRLVMPHPDIMRVWKILGVDAVLPTYHSLGEAMLGR